MPISFTALTQRKRPTCYLYSACLDDTQRLVTVNYFFLYFCCCYCLRTVQKFTLTTSSFHFFYYFLSSRQSARDSYEILVIQHNTLKLSEYSPLAYRFHGSKGYISRLSRSSNLTLTNRLPVKISYQ